MPTVKVLIPTPLRKFTNEQETVSVEGDTIGSLLAALASTYTGLGKPLLDENGAPRRFVNLYLNGEDVRFLQNTETPLKDGDEVSIVPAIAGGASGSEVYSLSFNPNMYNTPILHNLSKRFRLTLTLRRAMLNEEGGWVEMEFTGPQEEIGRAIADLQTTGVNVTGPISDLVTAAPRQYATIGVGRGT
jgi:molybdopterin synthase sulfur carrier subunit